MPDSRFANEPSLAVMLAWMLIGAGRVDEVEPWLQRAERADAASQSWRRGMSSGDVLNLRAYQSSLAGDIETAAERAHHAITIAALLGLSECAHLRGDRIAAELLGQAITALDHAASPGILADRTAVVERRLRQGAPAVSSKRAAVLRLLPGRLTQREIGEALYLSMNTVKTHVRNIYRKLAVSSRNEAVEVARSIGLL